MKTEYCYSTDGDLFIGGYDSREEALKDCGDDRPMIYTGIKVPVKIEDIVTISDIESLLENMSVTADDLVGEIADGYPFGDVDEKDKEELLSIILKWMKVKKLEPAFYSVKDIVEHPPKLF